MPMTAPVARFSRRMPVVAVAIIIREVREVAIVIARRSPVIMCLRNQGFFAHDLLSCIFLFC